MFSPDSVERVQPSIVREGTSGHQHDAPLHEEEHVPFDVVMADLPENEENKSAEQIIQDKEAEIRELKANI